MSDPVLISLISSCVPAIVTVITAMSQNRERRKDAAKQSILQMIIEDKVSYVIDGEFPTNYGRICDEYVIYHKNGGNGEVTKKVEEYKAWYVLCEKKLKKGVNDEQKYQGR